MANAQGRQPGRSAAVHNLVRIVSSRRLFADSHIQTPLLTVLGVPELVSSRCHRPHLAIVHKPPLQTDSPSQVRTRKQAHANACQPRPPAYVRLLSAALD